MRRGTLVKSGLSKRRVFPHSPFTIKYKHLCTTGKALNTYSLSTFINHYKSCKKCRRIPRKIKKNNMYKRQIIPETTLEVNNSYEGETIEDKINRVVNNNEPITDGAPLIYTDRKNGVMAEYDIRTDRFEIAVDAMDKVTKSHLAKRAEMHAVKPENDEKNNKNETGGQSIQATE